MLTLKEVKMIDPKILETLKNSGVTCKEMIEIIKEVWQALPTTKQLANNFYANLKYWRDK